MPEPYNYAAQFPQQDFSQSFLGGLQGGLALRAQQEQQALQKEAMQLKIQQAQQAMQQQQAQQDVLRNFSQIQNPTSQDYSKLMLQLPGMTDQLKAAWEMQDKGTRDNNFNQVSQVYTALQSGQPEVAKDILNSQARVYEAAGQTDKAKALNTLSQTIDIDPKGAQLFAYANLHAEDPKRAGELVDNIAKVTQQPYETTIKQAEARTKAAQAAVAPETEALKLQGLQTEEAAKRQDIRIKNMDAELRKAEGLLKIEESPLRREQLQLQVNELRTKIGDEQRDKVATAKGVLDSYTQTTGTIDQLLKHPGLRGAVGTRVGFAKIPGTDEANAQALIDTVKSSGFIANLLNAKQGGAAFGALSEGEGKKLENMISSLDQNQDEKSFRASLVKINDFINTNTNRSLEKNANLPVIDSPTRGKITGQHIIDAARKAKVKPWEMYQFLNKEANQ